MSGQSEMRIGLVADTHMPRFGKALPAALVAGLRGCGLILHAGDLTQASVVPLFEALAPFDAVAGNNDGPELVARFGRRKILTVANRRIGLVHGDGTRKTTRDRAIEAFAGEQLAAIVYGHSHIPACERLGETWLINPGSPTDKRRQPLYSYGLLELGPQGVRAWIETYADKSP